MKVWIDICHTPQYNFYRNLILRLLGDGHDVLITVLRRGKTPIIVQRELTAALNAMPTDYQKRIHVYQIGRHRMTKWSALIEANILRLCSLFIWRLAHRVDVAYGNGMQPAIIQTLFRGPSYSFDDDPQTMDFKPKARFNTECNFCLYEDEKTTAYGGNVQVLRCLKEWAYLAPNVFHPNVAALDKYGVQPKQYIFLREVSVGTVNYASQAPQAILAVKDMIAQTGLKVLFSLEEKHRRNEYPADWILLQEPIEDIHSLMYYSAGLVSSGDSMAREAALLGIPSYYLGTRHSMPANLAASKVANLQNEKTQSFSEWIEQIKDKSEDIRTANQEALRQKIDAEFIDINAYMLSLVEQLDNKQI